MNKKIFMFSMIVLLFYSASAQDSCDYNPYRHQREEYIQTGNEFLSDLLSRHCNQVDIQLMMDQYDSDSINDIQKEDILLRIVNQPCPEVIPFLINIIKTNQSEEIRMDAIRYLGWHRYDISESKPFLLLYAKNENISKNEKLRIATALCVMGEYISAKITLDCFCYDTNGLIDSLCVGIYDFAGYHEPAIRFYEIFFNRSERFEDKLSAALKLAEYGYYEMSFPIFVEALKSDNQETVCSGLFGLAIVGDDISIQLIKDETSNKNYYIANKSKTILTYMERRKKAKCKK